MRGKIKCGCGCGQDIKPELYKAVEEIEKQLLVFGADEITVNSGFRCVPYNAKIGGVPGSAHTIGLAIDASCESGWQRLMLIRTLIANGIHRIGIGKTFVHFDIDETKPKSIWLY